MSKSTEVRAESIGPGRRLPWRRTLHRARAALRRRPGKWRGPWSYLVPVIMLGAGVLFASSALTAKGTALRNDGSGELKQIIEVRRKQVSEQEDKAARLRREVDGDTEALSGLDPRIAEQQRRAAASRESAGMTAVRGPSITVQLDDAPRQAGGDLPNGARPDDVVVHQQDVQAVVNALWAGGAEAMTIMDVRVISTSAVRCVGNTLLLHGRVYSPPFRIVAIGDPARMMAALDNAPGVQEFRAAVRAFGLGYEARTSGEVTMPAYTGSTGVTSAQVAQ
ncbi:DUF881 domain-containing protein [Longispora albida]|uniref:DUF881 domain-containing protein n=1 Tax=Longispora albida TaxID=203523 RepID=UPI00037ED8F4|nr:DUF881 domain-containing protein [Longispora albida]